MSTENRTRGLAAWFLGALLAVVQPLSAPALAGMIDQITEAGVIRIAVPADLPPFGSQSPLQGNEATMLMSPAFSPTTSASRSSSFP